MPYWGLIVVSKKAISFNLFISALADSPADRCAAIILKVPNQHFVNLRFRKIKNIDYKLTCRRPYFYLVLPRLYHMLCLIFCV